MNKTSKEYILLKSLYEYFESKIATATTMQELEEYNEQAYNIMKLLYEADYGVPFKEVVTPTNTLSTQ